MYPPLLALSSCGGASLLRLRLRCARVRHPRLGAAQIRPPGAVLLGAAPPSEDSRTRITIGASPEGNVSSLRLRRRTKPARRMRASQRSPPGA